MKQQFARIRPSSMHGPQQESPTEERLSGEAQANPGASLAQGETPAPPSGQNSLEKSPASYWAREVPEGGDALASPTPYPQNNVKQVPIQETRQAIETQPTEYNPAVRPVLPQDYGTPPRQVPPPVANAVRSYPPAMNQPQAMTRSQNGQPMVLPPPGAQRPPYSPPMQSSMPPTSQGPMLQNHAPPMQPPYGPPMQSPPGRSGKTSRKKRRFPIWARVVVALVAVLLVSGGTAFGYYQANFADPLGKITGQTAAHVGTDGKSTSQAAVTGNGIGSQRTNILLLGSDNDGKNAAPLAQTDIVLTIDPKTNYVGMLSIPRDLRVSIPNQGNGKMDAAFSFGWQSNLGGSTPLANAAGLSIATVEQNFGIHIDHYAWVGLDGFVKVINTAGGVDIDAIHPIADNSYPNDVNTADHFGYKRLYITPGPQHMDGIQALEYVRTRHADLVGDFGRSARQQQVLSQLKTKLDTASIITRLPELTNDLGDTVKTDMSIQDIINFMGYARNIDTTKIDRIILSPPYSSTAPDTTGDFLPNCSLIMPKIAQMFDLGNTANCISTANTNAANTAIAANQPTIPATSILSTTALSSSVNTATQILDRLHPIERNEENTTEVHSLLDLMFLVAFDSFDATKV